MDDYLRDRARDGEEKRTISSLIDTFEREGRRSVSKERRPDRDRDSFRERETERSLRAERDDGPGGSVTPHHSLTLTPTLAPAEDSGSDPRLRLRWLWAPTFTPPPSDHYPLLPHHPVGDRQNIERYGEYFIVNFRDIRDIPMIAR